jgi:hypothetical protein
VTAVGEQPLSPAQLAAGHAEEARAAAQRCIDELEEIRARMRLDGTATEVVELIRAAPARDPRAPRPRTRAERDRQLTGHVAAAELMTLSRLLNLLTPGGYAPDRRLYLIDPPEPGTPVDPQARR